jgi:hypothetical protein
LVVLPSTTFEIIEACGKRDSFFLHHTSFKAAAASLLYVFGFNIAKEFCHFHCKKSLVISAMTFNIEKHRQEVLFQIQSQSFFLFSSSSSSSSSYVVHDLYWNVCGFALCVWKFFGGLSI